MAKRSIITAVCFAAIGFATAAWVTAAWVTAAWADEVVREPPLYSGTDSARGVVGELGGVFILTGPEERPMMVVAAGLFDKSSAYEYELGLDERVPDAATIDKGFRTVGPTLRFSRALDATTRPIEVSILYRARKYSTDHVLAVEQPELCVDRQVQQTQLCTRWEILPTNHFDGRLRARIPVTGGMRMQFGTVTQPASHP